jgi:cysteine-rich repeat protein
VPTTGERADPLPAGWRWGRRFSESRRRRRFAPGTASVQALGTAGEYQLAGKLYFNSLVGFGAIAAEGAAGTAGNPGAAAELTLAQYEAFSSPTGAPAHTNIVPILNLYGYFGLGSASPQNNKHGHDTNDTPFCEDFNEHTICGAVGNANGCTNNDAVAGLPGETGANPATAPIESTICGDGIVEAYEECDGTAKAGTGCSSTCRCVLNYDPASGACK